MNMEELVKLVVSEKNQDDFFELIFSDDNQIDREKLVDHLSRLVSDADDSKIDEERMGEVISSIWKNELCFKRFLMLLKQGLIDPDNEDYSDPSEIQLDVMDAGVFWSMVPIAMKKCLGVGLSKIKIENEINYFSEMPADLNQKQVDCHKRCIKSFNLDAGKFSRKKYKDLGVFLHNFHSNNKRPLTKKKNLKRVERRVKRIMQAYKVAHNGMGSNIFSDGRYKVPEQFSNYLHKKYLEK